MELLQGRTAYKMHFYWTILLALQAICTVLTALPRAITQFRQWRRPPKTHQNAPRNFLFRIHILHVVCGMRKRLEYDDLTVISTNLDKWLWLDSLNKSMTLDAPKINCQKAEGREYNPSQPN